jgi:hypothetical protein
LGHAGPLGTNLYRWGWWWIGGIAHRVQLLFRCGPIDGVPQRQALFEEDAVVGTNIDASDRRYIASKGLPAASPDRDAQYPE